ICRVLNGMWQTSGGWGRIDRADAVDAMLAYADAGLSTFDMADHYGPAEDLYGMFINKVRRERPPEMLEEVRGLTKWVPPPVKMTRSFVEENINRSRKRMDVAALDMLQFHWVGLRKSRISRCTKAHHRPEGGRQDKDCSSDKLRYREAANNSRKWNTNCQQPGSTFYCGYAPAEKDGRTLRAYRSEAYNVWHSDGWPIVREVPRHQHQHTFRRTSSEYPVPAEV
uniref:NADP-dependent oxidoreductase domain-containing protein n=1 Tax=Aegilops tauschii subsp. strangulata TaxID=200361 RepID=A0A453H0A7_AEGTS